MTIAIHPGLAKCGSSSIHSFLKTNRNTLSKTLQISYPGPRRPGADLARELRERKSADPFRSTLTGLAKNWAQSPESVLVLSSELLQDVQHDGLITVRDTLSGIKHDEFIIVFVVRDLIELVPSVYAQMVQGKRNTCDFDLFFEDFMAEKRANYSEILEVWAAVFGWGSLRVRVLDSLYLTNQNLLDDFLSVLGVAPGSPQSLSLDRTSRVSNATPGWKVTESLRSLFNGTHGLRESHPLIRAVSNRRAIRGFAKMATSAGLQCGWNADRGRYLTRAQAQRCFEVYNSALSAANRHLEQAVPMPVDLNERGFLTREFMPDAKLLSAHEKVAFFDALWVAICRGPEKIQLNPS